MKITKLFTTSVLLSFVLFAHAAFGQSTEFTYQGRLLKNSLPLSANCNFSFLLFDSLDGGTQLGGTQTFPSLPVENGIFTVRLDFGAQFTGAARFIEIAVGCGEAQATLAPRQAFTSAPYSIRSGNSGNADALSSACSLCITDAQISGLDASKLTGVVPISNGGTGASIAATARTNLGLGTLATVSPTGTADATTFLRGDNSWSNGPVGPPGPQGPPGPVDIVASINTQFSQDDRSGWTHIETLGDDTCFLNIPLGFAFTGWGRSNATISVSSNGVLFFGQNCSSSFNNAVLPSGISQDPFLAFFWDDLFDYGSGDYLEYSTIGSPGGRVFNMYFRNRLLSATCGTDTVNLMLAIHEGSNLVRVSYSGMSGCSLIRGSSATFGMQGPGGGASRVFIAGVDSPILDDNADRNMISYLPPRQ